MNTTREKSWMCISCGYVMDAATHVGDGTAVPDEDSISLCLNCGELYMHHNKKWVLMTNDEYTSLPDELKIKLYYYNQIRRNVIIKDLAFKNLS